MNSIALASIPCAPPLPIMEIMKGLLLNVFGDAFFSNLLTALSLSSGLEDGHKSVLSRALMNGPGSYIIKIIMNEAIPMRCRLCYKEVGYASSWISP
jgi:hypothetical protein